MRGEARKINRRNGIPLRRFAILLSFQSLRDGGVYTDNFGRHSMLIGANMHRVATTATALLVAGLPLAGASAQGLIPDSAWGGWDGFYVGAEVGGKVASADWRATGANDLFPGVVVPDATGHPTLTGGGLRGGVYGGYTWQFGKWVLGPDFDFGLADDSVRRKGLPGCSSVTSCNGSTPPLPTDPMADDFVKVNPTWDANVRGRLGYLLTPNLLAFASGGMALQEVEISGGCRAALWDTLCAGPPFGDGQTKTQTNTSLLLGWTAGAGLEARLDDHWRLRGEYRYSGFSPTSGTFWAGQPTGIEGWNTYHYKVSLQTQVATVGLSYQF
jgi:outer membrane immunogenic protein